VPESVCTAEQMSDGTGTTTACHLDASTADGSQPNWLDSHI